MAKNGENGEWEWVAGMRKEDTSLSTPYHIILTLRTLAMRKILKNLWKQKFDQPFK
jgi:hypothetical protein